MCKYIFSLETPLIDIAIDKYNNLIDNEVRHINMHPNNYWKLELWAWGERAVRKDDMFIILPDDFNSSTLGLEWD